MTSFFQLGLTESTLKAIEETGYTEPTPIQAQAIASVLQGRDVLASAQTGTGKTAAFTLPAIDILIQSKAKARMPRVLIIEPTRELAAQVAENFDIFSKYTDLTRTLLIGGESFIDQEKELKKGVDGHVQAASATRFKFFLNSSSGVCHLRDFLGVSL